MRFNYMLLHMGSSVAKYDAMCNRREPTEINWSSGGIWDHLKQSGSLDLEIHPQKKETSKSQV